MQRSSDSDSMRGALGVNSLPFHQRNGDIVATWAEVKQFIGSNYVVSNTTDRMLTLEFPTQPDRSQLVFVMGIEDAEEMNGVRFFSAFAEVGQISPAQFAQLANNTLFGLAEQAGYYGLVHMSFLADLDASEIHVPMLAVAAQADKIERQLGLGDGF